MEQAFGTTSFIPKKTLTPRRDLSVSGSGVLVFVSILILIASAVWYFVALNQESSKTKDINTLQSQLQEAEQQFPQDRVVKMVRFDTKLKVAKDLLYLNTAQGSLDTTEHITLLPLFKLLSDHTLKSVRFKDFKYSNPDNQKIQIKMRGEASGTGNVANYAAIAQQAKEFSDTNQFTNVIVSDLNLGSSNNVIFNITASVRPELVSYSESLK